MKKYHPVLLPPERALSGAGDVGTTLDGRVLAARAHDPGFNPQHR